MSRPFRFEDLNGEPEPEAWGPVYPNLGAAVATWRKKDRATRLSDADKCAYGAAVGAAIRALQRRELIGSEPPPSISYAPPIGARRRATLTGALHSVAARDRAAYAMGRERGINGLHIEDAYKAAMAEKLAPLALAA